MDTIIETYWLPIILAVIASSPGIISLIRQYKKDKAEERVIEADTSERYERIARSAADQVITKSARIDDLEKSIEILKTQMEELRRDKYLLAEKNRKLENRVKILEETLEANNIPVPNGKDKS